MSNILWSPESEHPLDLEPNSPVSAKAYGDEAHGVEAYGDLPCLDLPPLGVAEAGTPLSPGCVSSSTVFRSAKGSSPKAKRARKKTEVYHVEYSVPRKPRVMHGAGRVKKVIVKKVRGPCLRFVVLDCWSLHFISRYLLKLVCCRMTRTSVRWPRAVRQRRRFVTTPLLRLLAVICRLPLQMMSGSSRLLPSTHRPLSS